MTLDEHPRPEGESDAPGERTSPRHRAAVIRRIRTLMEFWNITEDELRKAGSKRVAAPAPVLLEIKYRHPVSGDTWTGDGPQPDWLRQALLREGFTVDELRRAALLPPPAPTEADASAETVTADPPEEPA